MNLLASYLGVKKISARQAYSFSAMKVLAALREMFWGVTGELSGSCALSAEEAREYTDKGFTKFSKMHEDFEALPMPKIGKGKIVYDYSGLQRGMHVQVEFAGSFYVADVTHISVTEKRANAPVKISYRGYEGYDEWVGGNRLRSKALAIETPERPARSPRRLVTDGEISIRQVARVYRGHVVDETAALKLDAVVNEIHAKLSAMKKDQAKGYMKTIRQVCKTEWAYECTMVWRNFDSFKEYEECAFGKDATAAFEAQLKGLINGDLYNGVRVFDEL